MHTCSRQLLVVLALFLLLVLQLPCWCALQGQGPAVVGGGTLLEVVSGGTISRLQGACPAAVVQPERLTMESTYEPC
jgi:hypothetical protein